MDRHLPSVAVTILILSGLSTPATSQTEKRLSAREIFYSAPKAVAKKKPATPRAEKPPRKEVAVSKPATRLPSSNVPEKRQQTVQPPDVQYVKAVAAAEQLVPLGLRYAILKRDGAGQAEVDPGSAFRAGDRIRVRVEVNDTGYLYIIHRGSSGNWKPLFPSSEIEGGSNVVHAGRSYDIPPSHVFTFDEQPGEEKLFIVLCRQPETDLENLVYEMSGARPSRPAPAEAAPVSPQPKILLAQNLVSIGDDYVDQLRNAYARDLIIEKVDQSTAGPMKETAVYAVSATATADSRVVVDISLDHR